MSPLDVLMFVIIKLSLLFLSSSTGRMNTVQKVRNIFILVQVQPETNHVTLVRHIISLSFSFPNRNRKLAIQMPFNAEILLLRLDPIKALF